VKIRAKASSASGAPLRFWLAICSLALSLGALLAANAAPALALCPNEAIRSEQGATFLPDCRAYELVTPRKMNGFPAEGTGSGGLEFSTSAAAPGGDKFLWALTVAGLPDTESNGYQNQYDARRSATGWTSVRLNPTASEAEAPAAGAVTPNHEYATFYLEVFRGGSLAYPCGCYPPGRIMYVRYPDGTFHLLGEGTVAASPDTDGHENGFIDDPLPAAEWITDDGSHQIFSSGLRLVPAAPSDSPNSQVYDRTPSGLKLVSFLPGGTPPSTQSLFAGASPDGSTVLFHNGGNLYARLNNQETVEIASGSGGVPLSGGVNDDGSRAFFAQAGNLYFYDFASETALPIVSTGDAVMSNVSADGSHVYFLSNTAIIPGKGTAGSPNLYVWNGASIKFIGTVTEGDVSHGGTRGLGGWAPAGVGGKSPGTNAVRVTNTTRSSSDGNILVFESRAQLTAIDNTESTAAACGSTEVGGERCSEIYRYDAAAEELTCISCSGAATAGTGDSELVTNVSSGLPPEVYINADVPNLSSDGLQVVFDSTASLLPEDINGLRDVYEWHDGAISLISTGHSPQPSHVLGVNPSGSDVFFGTSEALVGRSQPPGAPAIYDARAGGGLTSQLAEPPTSCLGEACLGRPSDPPALTSPSSSALVGSTNIKPRCRVVKRHKPHGRKRHRRRHGGASSSAAARKACRSARGRTGK
jgi:hypothetical protein